MPDLTATRSIFDLEFDELSAVIKDWGEASFRAGQVWNGLYQNFWHESEEFTTLPRSMKARLADQFTFQSLQPEAFIESSDGHTQKTLFILPDRLAIETVLMRYEKRRTLCISTQAGCGMGCVFCATGQMGFKRNLTSGEIVEQVLYFARQLADGKFAGQEEKVTNIVFMGMGEPFHNYDATMKAVDILNHPAGYNFGQRRMTISTVGLVPAIKRFTAEHRQVNLAVSLHAAEDELRSSMLPINKRYPLESLIDACREYVWETRRRITFEWALIQDVNDTPEQAQKLAKLLDSLLCHVNVIPLNPTKGYQGSATTRERAIQFKEILESKGLPCTIRIRRGIDIQAGCGQLAIKSPSNRAG